MSCVTNFDYTNVTKCVKCGRCIAYCPTYREFLLEITSPRGRVALINAFLEGKLELTEKLEEAIFLCLDCRACYTYCPSGVKPGMAVLEMRSLIESAREKHPLRTLVLEHLLTHPDQLRLATFPVRLYQRLGIQKALRKLGVLKPFPFALAQLEAMLPQYQGAPLTSRIDKITPAIGERKMRAGFFLGCAMNLILPRASAATIEVVSKLGCEIVTPKEVKCCGAPHMNEGDCETALQLARENIDLFLSEDVDVIFTDCAACGAEIINYPHLFGDDPKYKAKAEELSRKMRDVSELIVELGFDGKMCKPLDNVVVTFDEPCHLCHGQGVKKQPYTILKSLPGVTFRPLKESEWCCGSAGTYWLNHKETADRILDRKMQLIKETNADYIVTANPGCILQLTKGVRRAGIKAEVIHLTELLQKCLDE